MAAAPDGFDIFMSVPYAADNDTTVLNVTVASDRVSRFRTLSKLETLFHVTNVTTVLNVTVASDRVSRCR